LSFTFETHPTLEPLKYIFLVKNQVFEQLYYENGRSNEPKNLRIYVKKCALSNEPIELKIWGVATAPLIYRSIQRRLICNVSIVNRESKRYRILQCLKLGIGIFFSFDNNNTCFFVFYKKK